MKLMTFLLALVLSANMAFAAKKIKKKSAVKSSTDLTEQANIEVNEPVKIIEKNPRQQSNDSGLISVQSLPSSDLLVHNNYDVGLSFSNLQTLGVLTNKKSTTINLAEVQQPYLAQLDFNKNMDAFMFFKNVGLQIGFNQFYAQSSATESVLVSQSFYQISTAIEVLKQQKNEFDFISHFGFLNFQAASRDNAFLNINDKTYFVGGGFEYSYQLNQKLKLFTNALYRSKILSQTDLQLKTLAGTLGASYLW